MDGAAVTMPLARGPPHCPLSPTQDLTTAWTGTTCQPSPAVLLARGSRSTPAQPQRRDLQGPLPTPGGCRSLPATCPHSHDVTHPNPAVSTWHAPHTHLCPFSLHRAGLRGRGWGQLPSSPGLSTIPPLSKPQATHLAWKGSALPCPPPRQESTAQPDSRRAAGRGRHPTHRTVRSGRPRGPPAAHGHSGARAFPEGPGDQPCLTGLHGTDRLHATSK